MANQNTPGTEKKQVPCTIKLLPEEQWITAAATAVDINPLNAPATNQFKMAMPGHGIAPQHLALLTAKYWGKEGVHLTVGFMGNESRELRTLILAHMNAWGNYANVSFRETQQNPQVRIATTPGDGHWSYLGTDILHIPANEPTMNLDGFTMNTPASEFFRVVRHETGHTLGFPHEHMRKEIVEQIDDEKAITYFMHTQGWSRQQVIDQVLTPLQQAILLATPDADINSIMCYWLPGQIMKNGIEVPGGNDIDANDASFAALIYPKSGASPTMPHSVSALRTIAARLELDTIADTVGQQVKQVFSRVTGKLPGDINDTDNITEDLRLTSLEVRALAMPFQYIARQYKSGVKVFQSECQAQKTVQDCIDLIHNKIQ